MKTLLKTSLAAALLGAAALASAQVTAFATYDYDGRKTGDIQEGTLGAMVGTKLGTLDASLVRTDVRFSPTDRLTGFDFGYSYPVTLGRFTVTPRLGYGVKNQGNKGGPFVGQTHYYTAGGEVSTALAPTVTGFAGYTFRRTADRSGNELFGNRYIAGVDLAVSKSLTVRAGYARLVSGGEGYHGVTGALYWSL